MKLLFYNWKLPKQTFFSSFLINDFSWIEDVVLIRMQRLYVWISFSRWKSFTCWNCFKSPWVSVEDSILITWPCVGLGVGLLHFYLLLKRSINRNDSLPGSESHSFIKAPTKWLHSNNSDVHFLLFRENLSLDFLILLGRSPFMRVRTCVHECLRTAFS